MASVNRVVGRKSMSDESATKGNWLIKINVVVTILLAIVTGWSKFKLDDIGARVMERESERKDMELIRINRESQEKKQLTIYDAVVKSLETDDPKRQKVAMALVTSMLDLDNPLRAELLAVIGGSGSPEIKVEAKRTLSNENLFQTQTNAPVEQRTGTSFNWEDFDYDIFWCESSGGKAEQTANSIVARLKSEGAKGRLRARLLPDSINARPGYQHSGYVVRFNNGEEKQANELVRVGNSLLQEGSSFTASLSGQPTPWYLSAFVCPSPTDHAFAPVGEFVPLPAPPAVSTPLH